MPNTVPDTSPATPRANMRARLPDFAGRPLSLPDNPEAWECFFPDILEKTAVVLLLGLGPGNPEDLPFTRSCERVFWLDDPQTLRRLEQSRQGLRRPLPAHWQQVSPCEATNMFGQCRAYFYRYGRRLAPKFWGPLLGRMGAAPYGASAGTADRAGKAVLLPGTDAQLLHQELRHALGDFGFPRILEASPPLRWDDAKGRSSLAALKEMIAGERPQLLLSVNFRGLDPDGDIFHFCRALGVPVAVWCVDNPWHLLCGVRLPWWREAALFVSDAGFIADMRAEGAERLCYLPLAAAPHMLEYGEGADAVSCEPQAPLFVGRSAFPEQQRFFAAAQVPPRLDAAAAELLRQSGCSSPAVGPNFHWWRHALGVGCWPGQDVRRAGLGADECSRARRAAWIAAGRGVGLRIIGDAGWGKFAGFTPLPPVDYYAALPKFYRQAEAVLNVTSLLLPHSLSQRHFDVWAAGGLLLSDATPGLALFPDELTGPITLDCPDDFAGRLAALRADSAAAQTLRAAWRRHIRDNHTYRHRVARICEALEISF